VPLPAVARTQERRLAGALGEALLDSFSVESLMESSFPLLLKMVPADGAALCITRAGRDDDYLWKVSGISLDWFRDYPELAAQDLVRQAVLRRPNTVLREEHIAPRPVLERNPWVERSREMGMSLRHVMAVMLRDREPGWHGGITLYRERSRAFSDRHRQLLQQLTPALTKAVRNCRRFGDQARRNDILEWLLRAGMGEAIIMIPPDREEERSAGATALLEKYFSTHDRRSGGLPRPLLELFARMSRHPEPGRYPRDIWWGIGDGQNLKVSFIPLPYREGGPRRWAWVLKEQSDQVSVPWSWRESLTPEESEVLEAWRKEGSAVALKQSLTSREHAVAAHALTGQEVSTIAGVLGMHANTVKVHLHNIYDKVGARDRLSLFQRALRLR
jgi:DNA-binding CsgD family transcriptional regulator